MTSPPTRDASFQFTREVTWVDSSSCQACGKSYWIPWKHHCRACGGCFCQSCSSRTLALPPKHPEPVRVCDKCFVIYSRLATVPQPKHPVDGTRGAQIKVSSSNRDILSASLPADFMRGKIEEYSGSRPDPLSASIALGGDSPTAKWLTERQTASYYATPPPDSGSEPEVEEAEETNDEQSHRAPTDMKHQVPSLPSDDTPLVRSPEQAEDETEERPKEEHNIDKGEIEQPSIPSLTQDNREATSAGTQELAGGSVAPAGSAGHVTEIDTDTDKTAHEALHAEESRHDAARRSDETDATEEIEKEGEDQPENGSNNHDIDTSSEADSGSDNVRSSSDSSSRNVAEHRGGDVSGTENKQDAQIPDPPEENEVKELKEQIKLAEEEDKEATQKQEAIKHKLQSMNASKDYVELCNLAAKELSSSVLYGLRDSLRLGYASISIQKSNRVYNHIIDTFILNGPLLLFMYILFKYCFEPHFHSMLHWKEHRGFTLVFVEIMEFLLKACFLILWVGPIYVLSLVLNMQWSQEVGNGAFSLYLYIRRGKTIQKASKPLSDTIAQIIYWQIIFGVFNLINFLCKFVPVVGPPFYFLCLCWLNAVYCFDLKWGNQKWSLHKKISYCETRWLYFIGFGIPITLATFFFEYIICYSLLSLLFPLFIPMAMYGSPKTQSLWRPIPVSRILDSSIIAPLLRFIFTIPSQVESLERKTDTILRLILIAVCSFVGIGVTAYLAVYFIC